MICNRETVSYRKLKNIDVDLFRRDILHSTVLNDCTGNVDELTERYVSGLSSLIDTHAPIITRVVTLRPDSPWYTESLRDAKTTRRGLERDWRKGGKKLEDRKLYRDQCSNIARELNSTKTDYYSTKVSECKHDTKQLFNITNKLLTNQQIKLPVTDNDEQLANNFGTYFEDKIDNIRINIERANQRDIDANVIPLSQVKFDRLKPTSEDEVQALISSCANKQCDLDPIPTWLLKLCITELLTLITQILNLSLSTGQFPQQFKAAIIKPHIKKDNLDVNELKNYRPVSNLHFLSKLLEKLVVIRLEDHMYQYNMHDPLQSAYKHSHSTETALLKIHNDIISSLDVSQCTVLASLDLSAAFDTVDHSTFIKRLKGLYGVEGTALHWFESYLHDRQYRVSISKSVSQTFKLKCGVPQGSVLGARLYTMYTYPLSEVIKEHNLMYHSYADDTQIYINCDNTDIAIEEAMRRLHDCITDVCCWMSKNTLKLNQDKTEFIIFSKDNHHGREYELNVGNNAITASKHIKILGVYLDSSMNLMQQITATSRSAYMHIRKINSIRQYLTESAVKTLIQSLVVSRLDYCNSLYYGLPLTSINRLQLVHNSAARVISRTPRHEHITPILRELHWLPIVKRCQFKLLVFIFKSLHNDTPLYICDELNWYTPTRNLRSASTTSLIQNRHKTVKYGRRLIDMSSASLWNALPNNIKIAANTSHFKKLLKTHFFII